MKRHFRASKEAGRGGRIDLKSPIEGRAHLTIPAIYLQIQEVAKEWQLIALLGWKYLAAKVNLHHVRDTFRGNCLRPPGVFHQFASAISRGGVRMMVWLGLRGLDPVNMAVNTCSSNMDDKVIDAKSNNDNGVPHVVTLGGSLSRSESKRCIAQ